MLAPDDGSLIAGLQSAAQAIVHVAGLDPVDPATVKGLTPGAAANMRRWSPEVRGMLLQQVMARGLSCAPTGTRAAMNTGAAVEWMGKPVWAVHAPSPATLASQAGFVLQYVDQRADRAVEVLSQMASFVPFLGIILGLNAAHPRTAELLGAVQVLAGQATMLPKHIMAVRRPAEVDARILPLIDTPAHGSFPSAHATQAFAMATVAAALVRAAGDTFGDAEARIKLLYRQAHRIAVNRSVAGVHYPIDSRAGALLGLQVGRIVSGLCGVTGAKIDPLEMAADDHATVDFVFTDIDAETRATPTRTAIVADPLFGWMWDRALDELRLTAAGA